MRHVSYAQALEAAVFEEMQRDSKVYYMGEDVGVFGGAISKMYSLFQTFPERVMDMPLDEKGFTGIAVGMEEWQIVPDKMDVIRAIKKTLGRDLLEEEKGQVEVDGVAELKKSRPKNDEA